MATPLSDIGLIGGAREFWENGVLLDYIIEVEDKEFRVHKLVLATASDYFRAMLTVDMKEGKANRARLEGLSPLVVSNLINFIYTREFGMPRAHFSDLITCADYLQIPTAIQACSKVLVTDLTDNNCLDTLRVCQELELLDGVELTLQYMKTHINDIVSREALRDVNSEALLKIMEFWQQSEWELLQTVMTWVQVDIETRSEHIHEIMSHVRFALLTPEQLEEVKAMSIYNDFYGDWCSSVPAAEEYHRLPIHKQVNYDSPQNQVRNKPIPVCFNSSAQFSNEFYALENGKSWKKCHSQTPSEVRVNVQGTAVVNNFLIVWYNTSVTTFNLYWAVFDPRTGTWGKISGPADPRYGINVVQHNKHMYALGGLIGGDDDEGEVTDLIEMYDFESDSWAVLPIALPHALECFSAVVAGDKLYIIDLLTMIEWVQKVYCLDFNTKKWSVIAPLKHRYDAPILYTMKLLGEEVIACIDCHLAMSVYRPSVDQWTMLNIVRVIDTSLPEDGANHIILPQDNSLYILNRVAFMDNSDAGDCVKWTLDIDNDKYTEEMLGKYPVRPHLDQHGGGGAYGSLLAIPPNILKG